MGADEWVGYELLLPMILLQVYQAYPDPTPVPPFAGVVQVYPVMNAFDGWGWQPGASVTVILFGEDGQAKETVSITTDQNGGLGWTDLTAQIAKGDTMTVLAHERTVEFPVQPVTWAVADPSTNKIYGLALPYSRIDASIEHPGVAESPWLETVADGWGHFEFDFTPLLDWEYGDSIWIGHWFGENAVVQVVNDSPELTVVEP